MKKNYIALSEAATKALQKAKKEYEKALTAIYPIGSRWWCTHGTNGEYKVEIKAFSLWNDGFIVENVETHARKGVHWSSLRSGD